MAAGAQPQPKTGEKGLQPSAGPDRGSQAGNPLPRRSAAKTIIDKDFRITKDRGTWYEIDGIKTMATFHPAYVLRQRGDDLNNAKRLVWKDIKNVYAEYQKAMEAREA